MEYVFDMERCAIEGRCGEVPEVTMGMDARRERIVRCRDCGHALESGSLGWVCCRLPFRFRTGPGSFCSWGERRPE